MNKEQVIILARELFKIRMSSSQEGSAENDGMHKMKIKDIATYNDVVIVEWYKEALKTAEIIVTLEEEYLNQKS